MAIFQTTFSSDIILNLVQDQTFEQIINQLVPARILSTNKETIKTLSQSLINLSPVSININDIFIKEESTILKNIQNTFSYQFLNDFRTVYDNAQLDPVLKNKLSDTIDRYNAAIGTDDLDVNNIDFYSNIHSVFSQDRYILSKNYRQEKGTKPGMEYAYRVAHDSQVEGSLRKDYYFRYAEGSYIEYENDIVESEIPITGKKGNVAYPSTNASAPANIDDLLPTDGKTIPGSIDDPTVVSNPVGNLDFKVGDFSTGLSTEVGTLINIPDFTYRVESSMLKPFWDHIVKPLSHPVGFRGDYLIRDSVEWIDYFSTTRPYYYADFISVDIIQFDGSLSSDLYSTIDGLPNNLGVNPITQSSLQHFEEGTINTNHTQYPGWNYIRYEFAPTEYLGESFAATLTYYTNGTLQVIEFYGVDFNTDGDFRLTPRVYDTFTNVINNSTMTGPFIITDTTDTINWDIDNLLAPFIDGLASGSDWVFKLNAFLVVGDFYCGETKFGDGPSGIQTYFNTVREPGDGFGESSLYDGDRSTDYIEDAEFTIESIAV